MSDSTPHFPHLAHSLTFPEAYHQSMTSDITIPEEDEETSSEPAEAITPTSDSHPPTFTHHNGSAENDEHNTATPPPATPVKPLIANTPATPSPPNTAPGRTNTISTINLGTPEATPKSQKRIPSSSLRSFFRRTNSQNSHQPDPNPKGGFPFEKMAPSKVLAAPQRRPSFARSADNSPAPSHPSTPPSPGSPTGTVDSKNSSQCTLEPEPLNRSNRASTGFNLRDRSRIMFSTAAKPAPPYDRKRSTSFNNLQGSNAIPTPDINVQAQGDFFTRPAATGAGLKARRMSVNLPDDFLVDTIELDKEFTGLSKVPGKRKMIGSGATATVKLMTKRGSGDEVYAVKEFRKRSQAETVDEYDKKVKSEYTIAKSLHHPNLIDSFRLCSHSARWNVVMEYCVHGELFTLVQRKYLQQDDHLCLFKQLLKGVGYLHDHGIAHRDIKLENLLMNDKGHLKITDFGVSEVFSGEHPGLRESGGECGKNMKEIRKCAPGICGSKPYIAPEVLAKNGEYDPRPLDVWSCAIVYLSMHFGGQPWAEATTSDPGYKKFYNSYMAFLAKPDENATTSETTSTLSQVPTNASAQSTTSTLTPASTSSSSTGSRAITELAYPTNIGKIFTMLNKQGLKLLILKMLHPDPEARIKIQDILNDRWLKGVDCCIEYEDAGAKGKLDVSKKSGVSKATAVRRNHHHTPPPPKSKLHLPQHRFDMGDGWQ
ncbi:hypothetical protein MMC25_005242 [Agyrium rufum]|nr:hypothetical protein [Agyrium rufum]